MLVDENHMKRLLDNSKVLELAEHSDWDWDFISELVDIIGSNPKRTEELIKNTKFATKMIHYLKPTSRQFSDLPVSANMKIITTCASFVSNLVNFSSGQRYLLDSKLIHEIVEYLSKLADPTNLDIDSLFSKDRMEKTMSKEYFNILGVLQESNPGMQVMNECRVWTLFYALIDLRGREDIVKKIINSGNYEVYAIFLIK
jgi:hypothetical protein